MGKRHDASRGSGGTLVSPAGVRGQSPRRLYLPAVRVKSLVALGLALALPAMAAPDLLARTMPPEAQLARLIVLALAALGLAALMVLHALWRPRQARDGSAVLRQRPLRCLLTGVIATAVLVLLTAIADRVVPPVQAAIGVLVLAAAVWAAIGGGAMLLYDVGDRALASLPSRYLGSVFASTLVGGLLFAALGLAPVLGQLAQAVLLILGAGILLNTRRAG